MPLYYIADICRSIGDLDACWQATALAFARDHITYQQVYFRGRAKRLFGDWTGWADCEARQFGPMFAAFWTDRATLLAWTRRRWDGSEPLGGKTLLVSSEQSDSDTLQMWRFVDVVATSAERVIVTASPPLTTILRRMATGKIDVISDTDALPTQFDRFVWLQSLPWLIGDLPPTSFAPRGLTSRRPRAGGMWYDDATQTAIRTLLLRSDVHWTDLRSLWRATHSIDYENLVAKLEEFDFVVTTDSPVCHLAAHLGLPVLLVLPTSAHWRWGVEDCTPWYPSVRILRQHEPSSWDDVLRSLNRILDRENRL
jgi:hypothetical protein